MSETLEIRTSHHDASEVVRELAPFVDDVSIRLLSRHAIADGEWVRFTVLLADGSPFLEGIGRSQGSTAEGRSGHRIHLSLLQFDERNEITFERVVLASDEAENTGTIDIRAMKGTLETPSSAPRPRSAPPPPSRPLTRPPTAPPPPKSGGLMGAKKPTAPPPPPSGRDAKGPARPPPMPPKREADKREAEAAKKREAERKRDDEKREAEAAKKREAERREADEKREAEAAKKREADEKRLAEKREADEKREAEKRQAEAAKKREADEREADEREADEREADEPQQTRGTRDDTARSELPPPPDSSEESTPERRRPSSRRRRGPLRVPVETPSQGEEMASLDTVVSRPGDHAFTRPREQTLSLEVPPSIVARARALAPTLPESILETRAGRVPPEEAVLRAALRLGLASLAAIADDDEL